MGKLQGIIVAVRSKAKAAWLLCALAGLIGVGGRVCGRPEQ
jgi:hypothetical protein